MKTKLKVNGMHCVTCAVNIEKKLNAETNISAANVNFATGMLFLNYDEKNISLDKIVGMIEKLGYTVIKNESDFFKNNETPIILKKFLFSLIFTIFIFYLSMAKMFNLILPKIINPTFYPLNYAVLQLILTIPIVIIGHKFYTSGYRLLVKRMPNMDSLIALGTSASFVYSLFAVFKIFNKNLIYVNNLYFEATGMIITLILLGKFLESRAKEKTTNSIKKLLELQPQTANLVQNNDLIKKDVKDLKINDIILVKPGEKIPLDGVIIEGNTSINESLITGESLPVEKSVNDKVIGGSINQNGLIKVKITKKLKDSFLSNIIKLIEKTYMTKAPIQKITDVVAGYFVAFVLISAVLTFIIWILFGASFSFAIMMFVSVMVIACPCALGLAAPTSMMVGIGLGAKNNILIKSSEAIQKLSNAKTIMFDKTGTLTKGAPSLEKIILLGKYSNDQILKITASIEKNSEHIFADLIVKSAQIKKIILDKVDNVIFSPGMGVKGEIKNQEILVGNEKFLLENNVYINIKNKILQKELKNGKSLVYIAIDKNLEAVFLISDEIKKDSIEIIEALKRMKFKIGIITGDNRNISQEIADKLKIDFVLSDIMPSEKAKAINEMKRSGDKIIMVGDGINDAAALVAADIGMAIGSGTDIAIESADVVLVKNELSNVVNTIKLSKIIMKNVKQNLFWAFFYNIIGIPVAAGILFPYWGIRLNPEIAALFMSLSSVCVVCNALRLRSIDFGKI